MRQFRIGQAMDVLRRGAPRPLSWGTVCLGGATA